MHAPPVQPVIQPKLEINEPGDEFEQEADEVADQVMKMSGSEEEDTSDIQLSKDSGQDIQLKCAECEEEESIQKKPLVQRSGEGPATVSQEFTTQLNTTKGNGKPLNPKTSQELGSKMGTDLSKVKIHTDQQAVQMSQSINAKAFTHGQDIYFNQGQYNPESHSGKHLLAHELTHTVQQAGPNIQRKEKYKGLEDNIDLSTRKKIQIQSYRMTLGTSFKDLLANGKNNISDLAGIKEKDAVNNAIFVGVPEFLKQGTRNIAVEMMKGANPLLGAGQERGATSIEQALNSSWTIAVSLEEPDQQKVIDTYTDKKVKKALRKELDGSVAYRFTFYTGSRDRDPWNLLIERLGEADFSKREVKKGEKKFEEHYQFLDKTEADALTKLPNSEVVFKDFSDSEKAEIAKAAIRLPDKALEASTGLRFVRAEMADSDIKARAKFKAENPTATEDQLPEPVTNGSYNMNSHVIHVYDRAFNQSITRFGNADTGFMNALQKTIIHEIGHSIDFHPLRETLGGYLETYYQKVAVANDKVAEINLYIEGTNKLIREKNASTDAIKRSELDQKIGERNKHQRTVLDRQLRDLQKEVRTAYRKYTQKSSTVRAESGGKKKLFESDSGGSKTAKYTAINQSGNPFQRAAGGTRGKGITAYAESKYDADEAVELNVSPTQRQWHETYAESFAMYMADPERLKALRPQLYSYFNSRYLVYKKTDHASGRITADATFAADLDTKKGKGQKLDSSIGTEMSAKIGSDVSGVNIHKDGKADEMARSINAKAFTHDQDIYFKSGQYNPNSSEGKHLLAHELTHTVQQGGGDIKPMIQRQAEGLEELLKQVLAGGLAKNPEAEYQAAKDIIIASYAGEIQVSADDMKRLTTIVGNYAPPTEKKSEVDIENEPDAGPIKKPDDPVEFDKDELINDLTEVAGEDLPLEIPCDNYDWDKLTKYGDKKHEKQDDYVRPKNEVGPSYYKKDFNTPGQPIEFIVLHDTSSEVHLSSISAHFEVDSDCLGGGTPCEDGTIWLANPENVPIKHAGHPEQENPADRRYLYYGMNMRSLGIEFVNAPITIPKAYRAKSAKDKTGLDNLRSYLQSDNIELEPQFLAELMAMSDSELWSAFHRSWLIYGSITLAQKMAAYCLYKYLSEKYPGVQFISHEHVGPKTLGEGRNTMFLLQTLESFNTALANLQTLYPDFWSFTEGDGASMLMQARDIMGTPAFMDNIHSNKAELDAINTFISGVPAMSGHDLAKAIDHSAPPDGMEGIYFRLKQWAVMEELKTRQITLQFHRGESTDYTAMPIGVFVNDKPTKIGTSGRVREINAGQWLTETLPLSVMGDLNDPVTWQNVKIEIIELGYPKHEQRILLNWSPLTKKEGKAYYDKDQLTVTVYIN